MLSYLLLQRESNSVRVCIVHNRNSSTSPPSEGVVRMSHVIQVAHATLPSPVSRQFLVKVLEPDYTQQLLQGTKTFDKIAINVRNAITGYR